MDVTSINYINETNHYDNYIHKYNSPFLSSKDNKDVSSGSEYDSEKYRVRRQKNLFWGILLKKSKSFECNLSLLFFVINKNT